MDKGGGHPWSVETPRTWIPSLVALYVEIDDHVIPSARRRPGQPKRLSDADLVCLAVAQVLLRSAQRAPATWLRMCYARVGHLFPNLASARLPQGAQGRRAAAGRGAGHLARQCPPWHDRVRLIDATPVPYGAWAGDGPAVRASQVSAPRVVPRAHSRWYWGLKLHLVTTPGRDAGGLVTGQPEDRGTRGGCRLTSPRRPHRRAAAGAYPGRRHGLRRAGLRGPRAQRLRPDMVRPRRRDEAEAGAGRSAGSGSGSSRSTTPSGARSAWSGTVAVPPRACMPASPSGCWPWPPASGITGPAPKLSSGR